MNSISIILPLFASKTLKNAFLQLLELAMELFRPVGKSEYDLIEQSGFTKFPTRLPEQPIFYPVLNERYAVEIASKWNAKDGDTGYVLRFNVSDEYIAGFDVQTVGNHYHQEF